MKNLFSELALDALNDALATRGTLLERATHIETETNAIQSRKRTKEENIKEVLKAATKEEKAANTLAVLALSLQPRLEAAMEVKAASNARKAAKEAAKAAQDKAAKAKATKAAKAAKAKAIAEGKAKNDADEAKAA